MYKLVIQDDEGKTTVVPLMRDELTIGRKEGNTIRLTERNVSRAHAKVYRQSNSISIEDLDSYNGIRVNGSRIQGRVQLKESDRVQIGDYLIEVQSDARTSVPKPSQDIIQTTTIPVLDVAAATERMAQQPLPADLVTQVDPVEPVHAVESAKPPAVPGKEAVGRLVILSKNFAGEEFELIQPGMMIGRTEDNDIWINHRSISRHHAQIVRENGRYSVVDLQSANGVRVNGEEYGKVELRRGDLIDLGHVRMRFVEPGEDFLFGRDAQAVDIQVRRSSRFAMWLVGIALLVAGGVSYLAMQPGTDNTTTAGTDGPEPGVEVVVPHVPDKPDAAVVAVATRDAEPTPVVDARTPEVVRPPHVEDAAPTHVEPNAEQVLAELRDKARAAAKARDWPAAQASADALLAKMPGDKEASDILAQATLEAEMHAVLARIEGCKDDPCVATQYAAMKPNSVYDARARELYDAATVRYIGWAKGQAEIRIKQAKAEADCARSLERLGAQVGTAWPEAQKAVLAMRKQCPAKVEPVATKDPPEETPTRDPAANIEDLVGRAKAAGKAQMYGRAYKLCREVLASKPGHQDALMVCSMAACRLRKEDMARTYLGQIESSGQRSGIRQFCLKEGVNVD